MLRAIIAALLLSLPMGAEESVAQLSWLTGSWGGTVDEVVMEEVWLAPAAGVMVGVHRDVRKGRASFEFMRIEESADGVAFLAQPGGIAPVRFEAVELTASRVVFENPGNDYPQRIVYWKDGSRLCAAIELANGSSREEWCWSLASSR